MTGHFPSIQQWNRPNNNHLLTEGKLLLLRKGHRFMRHLSIHAARRIRRAGEADTGHHTVIVLTVFPGPGTSSIYQNTCACVFVCRSSKTAYTSDFIHKPRPLTFQSASIHNPEYEWVGGVRRKDKENIEIEENNSCSAYSTWATFYCHQFYGTIDPNYYYTQASSAAPLSITVNGKGQRRRQPRRRRRQKWLGA